MELHCLPVETPTTASSSSTDPLYDNCPPFTQRGRDREKEMESRVRCPAVTRLQGPCSPALGLAPAVAEVPTPAGGGRGAGARPDRSHCSWRGGLGRAGWETEQDPGTNRAGGGERGGARGSGWRAQYRDDRAGGSQSPPPSPEHRSTLSLYDNLPDPATPDSVRDILEMETSFPEHFEEPVSQARVPGQIQGLLEDEEGSEERSPWSSCEIILAESGSTNQDQNPDQDKEHLQELERDSASCGFGPGNLTRHLQRPRVQAPLPAASGCVAAWPRAEAGRPEQPPWAPRVPPPVPPADPSASALRSLLTSLQQQIVRQREEYEARIMSLEQRNEELQVEVVRLKSNLAQQRHWYQVVQAKIAESERERAAAEQRNSTLQKDMEQFFDTFGELNNEAKKTEYIVKSF